MLAGELHSYSLSSWLCFYRLRQPDAGAVLPGSLLHGQRHALRYCEVEHAGNNIVWSKLAGGKEAGNRLCGGELHLLRDLCGPDVERTSKNSGESEHVIDLVGIVAPARGDNPGMRRGLLRHYFRHRVGQRNKHRLG